MEGEKNTIRIARQYGKSKPICLSRQKSKKKRFRCSGFKGSMPVRAEGLTYANLSMAWLNLK